VTCYELSLLVAIYHNVRTSTSKPPQELVVEAAPASHIDAINIAYQIPLDWYKGKIEVIVEEACVNEDIVAIASNKP
jgi:hypothetical protein